MAKIYIPAAEECEILDDLDFLSPARTVRFSLDGIHYEMDLSEGHIEEMRRLLQPFIRFGHVVHREDILTLTSDRSSQGLDSED